MSSPPVVLEADSTSPDDVVDGAAALAIGGSSTPADDGVDPSINFLRFNQDVTSLSVSTSLGYKLFSLNATDVLECVHVHKSDNDPVVIVERLFSSSLVAVVNRSTPRKLRVCHFKKGTEICNYSYGTEVLSVRLNRARLVVCLEEMLYIHNIRDMKIMHNITGTPPNKKGICALSVNSDRCLLAYPGSSTTGDLQIFDAVNLQSRIMISAHEGPLAAMAFSADGRRIATASEKGTVIRVFDTEHGMKLSEFRRGMKRCAAVSSLMFSGDGQFLVLGSNTETVHIFKFSEEQMQVPTSAAAPGASSSGDQQQQALQRKEQEKISTPEEEGWGMSNILSTALNYGSNYLPAQVTDTLNQARAVATVTVPPVHPSNQDSPHQVALATISRKMRVLLATSDGYLYMYDLPGSEGSECVVAKQHKLNLDFSGGSRQQQQPATPSSLANPGAAAGAAGSSGHGFSQEPTALDANGPAVLPVTAPEAARGGRQSSTPPAAMSPVRDDEENSDNYDSSPPPVQTMPRRPSATDPTQQRGHRDGDGEAE